MRVGHIQLRREDLDVWGAIAFTVFLVGHRVLAFLVDKLSEVVGPTEGLPVTVFLNYVLCLWVLLVIWVAYRRWLEASPIEQNHAYAEYDGPDVVMLLDDSGRIYRCSAAAERILGYEPEDLMGEEATFIGGGMKLRTALKEGGVHRWEAAGRNRQGKVLPLEVTTAALNTGGTVMIVQDISDRKFLQEDLRRAKSETGAAVKVANDVTVELKKLALQFKELEYTRDSLMNVMVTDMITPIQVIELHHDLLKTIANDRKYKEEQECVSTLISYTAQLKLMLRSMIDLKRLESNDFSLQLEPHDLVKSIHNAIRMVGPMGVNHRLTFRKDAEQQVIEYDAHAVERVLVNLLVNAVKHAPHGHEVRTTLAETDRIIRVSVSYNSHGIPLQFRDKLFDKYAQIELDQQHIERAPGLALPYCKMVVEAHGGDIWVESREGMGCTFTMVLPKTRKAEDVASPSQLSAIQP